MLANGAALPLERLRSPHRGNAVFTLIRDLGAVTRAIAMPTRSKTRATISREADASSGRALILRGLLLLTLP
jgi:hypothetical protein